MEKLYRMNIDVAFYMQNETDIEDMCTKIEKALENICCDITFGDDLEELD